MNWLSNARIISIMAVIILHAAASNVTSNTIGSFDWWVGNFYDSSVRWCVPIFVMISGALLLDPSKDETLSVFYLKRTSRILIPIIFWSIFYLLLLAYRSSIDSADKFILFSLKRIILGTPYYHLWFLYMIAGLYIFVPFFRKITKNSSNKEIIFLTLILFAVSITTFSYSFYKDSYTPLAVSLFIYYIPYFFLGHVLNKNIVNMCFSITVFLLTLTIVLTAIGFYLVAQNSGIKFGLYFYSYPSMTVTVMSFLVFILLKNIKYNLYFPATSKLTLGIYLLHPLFLEFIQNKLVSHFSLTPLFSIPIVSIITFLSSLMCAYILSKTPFLRKTI
ncbi:acyltransferase [Pokkaliibacter sp. CJK22405]|uniref:acyltransferase n=1 Tax=Pokkaliibacter sp. CJK22405 TaxID=3384615 RepID=UPI00398537A1